MSRMQISDSPLAEAGRRYFSEQDAATWVTLLRPGFHLRAAQAGEPVAAYLGGAPLLPQQVEWPAWEGQGPLRFVGAVDCGEVPSRELDIALPESGQLLFFYFDGLGGDAVAYTDPSSVLHGTRVLYVPADAEIAEREAPEGVTAYPRLLLTGEVIATAPGNESPALIAAYGDPSDPAGYCDYPTVDPEGKDFWQSLADYRREYRPDHRIGGYPLAVQGAVESEAAQVLAHVARPSEQETDVAASKQLASRLVLLAQIDGDARAGMQWGDSGRLYWLIDPDDLAAGRFERAVFTWQSE